jgi:hypothetical protein
MGFSLTANAILRNEAKIVCASVYSLSKAECEAITLLWAITQSVALNAAAFPWYLGNDMWHFWY